MSLVAGRKVATTAYQSVETPSVAVPRWAPAADVRMSSANVDPLLLCARAVKPVPGEVPDGLPPVTSAAKTSSPAGTATVTPVSTCVPTPRLDTI